MENQELAEVEIEEQGNESEEHDETLEPVQETPHETVERVLRESQAGEQSDGDENEEQISEPDSSKRQVPDKKGVKSKEGDDDPLEGVDPELVPPARLNAKEKQLFNNLPKGLKRAFHKSIKNLEGMTTREQENLKAQQRYYSGIEEAVKPFVGSWARQGRSVPQAILELAAAQERLVNPQTRKQAFKELAQDLGLTAQDLAASDAQGVGNSQQIDVRAHPEFQNLQNQVRQLSSYQEQVRQAQVQQQAAVLEGQFREVQNERDQLSGQYIYPELHEADSLQRVKSLFQHAAGASPKEKLKNAVLMDRASRGESQSFQQNSLQTANRNNQIVKRAQAATSSVRGRGSSLSPTKTDLELPAEAYSSDPAETVRAALAQLRSR